MSFEKEVGTKFEIWLELLLKNKGYQNILRDVEYRKDSGAFRQIDVSYNISFNGKIYLVAVEAKYSSKNNVNYKLREVKNKKESMIGTIDNLVDEVFERQMFVGADLSILVTNQYFQNKVKKYALEKNIRILERNNLYSNFNSDFSLEDSINSVNLENYRMKKNIIYI